MPPTLLQGRPAFSPFRLASLQDALQAERSIPATTHIDAVEVYLLELTAPLDAQTLERCQVLLAAEGHFNRQGGFFVTPRKGTISPWSSKATDIFLHCGLQSIRRVERGVHFRLLKDNRESLTSREAAPAGHLLHDRMTEAIYESLDDWFLHPDPAPLRFVPLMAEGPEAMRRANTEWGLAMSPEEIDYLVNAFQRMQRDPTDAELVMFSQVNSEHCRHKIFNADWIVDGERSEQSLFDMIRNTHQLSPAGTLVAYSDNSGVLEGFPGEWWQVAQDGDARRYHRMSTQLDILCKVETHNHPTAISPFPGAATGVGGEIRDEGATGIGGRPKAGMSAFMVSHLRVPGYALPWEKVYAEFPDRLASPLDIMLEGPIGGASFGNEFGRPQLCGMFRTLELEHNDRYRGYHKPIMAAGGLGNLKREHVPKKPIPPQALIIQLGGPAMKIGLGGGAASSIGAGTQSEALDFDSVQRGNPEMERRCQQVIDGCIALGKSNPILSIHDIGAGGLSNGLPELIEKTGGQFHLRRVPNEDRSMSPMEIWCNESQERYVLGILPGDLDRFAAICERERCPFAVVGEATDDGRLTVSDEHFQNEPIAMEMGVLLGKTPRLLRDVQRIIPACQPWQLGSLTLAEAIDRVLRFPAVANKSFLITIGDRTVTGMVARDQMVGPWQTPVADVAVTTSTLESYTGEAMAIGERTPVALLDAAASGRLAIGECLTNIAATPIGDIGNVKLSANWMVAAGEEGEDANLYDTVRTVGLELCPALGISIPVGKDSMSMRTRWRDSDGREQKQVAPLSLLVTGFSPVNDVRKIVTPDLKQVGSQLWLIDLGAGKNRLGGSALAQVGEQVGDNPPDLEDPGQCSAFFRAIQELIENETILAYHDRSDGGLLVTVAEMAFAGRKGIELELDVASDQEFAALFAEELGAVLEVSPEKQDALFATLEWHGLWADCRQVGITTATKELIITNHGETRYSESITTLNRAWSELSYRMQALRDNPDCAREEYETLLDQSDPGLQIHLTYDPEAAFHVNTGARPKMAILREQGVNGQNEMAFAFDRAGFESFDVTMTDLLSGRVSLDLFAGLVACGGFSYGDVLGAGSGWAKSILYNERLKTMFSEFFMRPDTFTLGVCNGCQMIAQLKSIIPGAEPWPIFTRNRSEQFEARYVRVEMLESPSIFFQSMTGSRLPIAVAHGEGFADFKEQGNQAALENGNLVSMRYLDHHNAPATHYPANPNGSPGGITGITTPDGRFTLTMPHPERGFRAVQMSYRPADQFTGEAGPWLEMFRNARRWVG